MGAVVAVVAVVSATARRRYRLSRVSKVVADLELPPAVFKTCPWEPRPLIETGLRQWLRLCAPALRDDKAIGMPSHAVDEAWHGLILCTARYSVFCTKAYGKFLHHHPVDGAPPDMMTQGESMHERLRRTVVAWSLVAEPGEECVLWDIDQRLGLEDPWGLPMERISQILTSLGAIQAPQISS
ncbi:hypothetical protein [Mycolicibacterium conceptionense]|uniref:hypothetical protein n=1 Tax=Mycolicibacterium conceptionense TaxID=451644 RepID=UPI003D161B43